MHSSRI